MVCPFCNKDMEKGYIVSNGESISWIKEEDSKRTLEKENSYWIDSLNGVKYYKLKGRKTISYFCKECRKCIIDLNK